MLKENRITFLDGLRGVAIGLVLLYHSYARWNEIVPYGNKFSTFPVFKYGNLGVNLFFIISGFVILMTLEKCKSFNEFIWRRWLRLFPAMFVASILIYCSARTLFPERPNGVPSLRDLLPGLTFIQAEYWKIFHIYRVHSLEGAFWSLYVEIKFYLIFGAAYFILGSKRAILLLICLFVFGTLYPLNRISDLCDTKYLHWFAAGALFYTYFNSGHKAWLSIACLTALFGILFQWHSPPGLLLAEMIIVLIFLTVFLNRSARSICNTRILIFLGFISYPLYLIHENMLIAMIVKLGRCFPQIPDFFLPAIPVIILIGISWLIAAYAEPKIRELIRYCFDRLIWPFRKAAS